jgi:hypothetical protein
MKSITLDFGDDETHDKESINELAIKAETDQ